MTDVLIFGATPAGATAALAAVRAGARVLLLPQSLLPGGLTVQNASPMVPTHEEAVGGLAREVYLRVAARTGSRAGPPVWLSEPGQVDLALAELLAASAVTVVPPAELAAVQIDEQGRLTAVETTDGRSYAARVFLDATVAGDLLARADVPWTAGRESAAEFGEDWAGLRVRRTAYAQVPTGVDPYDRPGGGDLLPAVEAELPGPEGQADSRMPAACFRLVLTDQANDLVPIDKPADYDPEAYELLVRCLRCNTTRPPWRAERLPGRRIDVDAGGAVSMEAVGLADGFLTADAACRASIVREHLRWQQGWLWTLIQDPRVPDVIQQHVRQWGLCRSLHPETDHWPTVLDLRWGRRMRVARPVCEAHVLRRAEVASPIALGPGRIVARTCRRFVNARGRVTNEGALAVRDLEPWPIPVEVLLADRQACENLLSPTCPAATYVAACSLADQATQLSLASAAGTLAALATGLGVSPHDVPYSVLRMSLDAQGQPVVWQSRRIDPDRLDLSMH